MVRRAEPRADLDRRLRNLEEELLILGGMVEKAIARALLALKERDLEASRQVVREDDYIDMKRFEIEEECLDILATQQPMARDLTESREMLTQARRSGVTLMVAENYRYMSAVRSAKTLICDGAIGKLRMIQLQEEAYFQPTGWRDNREENGGGVLIDGGIHKADMLIYLAGMPETVFAASLTKALPGAGGDVGAVVMTKTPDGVVGIINNSWTASKHPAPPWVSISGTEGQIYFELGAPRLKIINRSGEQTLRFENDYQGLVPMVREFRDSIQEHREPITSGAAGIGALTLVLKAYESMERGEAVPIG